MAIVERNAKIAPFAPDLTSDLFGRFVAES